MASSTCRNLLQEVIFTSEQSGQLWNVCVWDLYTGTVEHMFKGGVSAANSLNLLRGDYLLTAELDKPLLHYWPLCRKESKQTRIVLPGKPTAVTVTQDCNYCIVAIAEKFYIWQLNTGNLLAIVSSHYQTIRCLCVSSDSSSVYTAGDDAVIYCWSLASLVDQTSSHTTALARPMFSLSDHSLPVTDLCLSKCASKSRLLTASVDQSCRLYDTTRGKQLVSFIFESSLTKVCMDSSQSCFYAGAITGAIYKVDLHSTGLQKETHVTPGDSVCKLFIGHSKEVTCLDLNLDGTVLASGSKDMSVRLWNTSSSQCIKTIPHKGLVTNILITYLPAKLNQEKFRPSITIKNFQRSKHVFSDDQFGVQEIKLPVSNSEVEDDLQFCRIQSKDLFKLTPQQRQDLRLDPQVSGSSDGVSGEMISLQEELERTKEKLARAMIVNKELCDFSMKHFTGNDSSASQANVKSTVVSQ